MKPGACPAFQNGVYDRGVAVSFHYTFDASVQECGSPTLRSNCDMIRGTKSGRARAQVVCQRWWGEW